MKTGRNPVSVFPLARVPIELLNPVRQSTPALESIRMLVAGPATRLGIEKQSFLVTITDMVVHVLRQRELTIELATKSHTGCQSRYRNLMRGLRLTCS